MNAVPEQRRKRIALGTLFVLLVGFGVWMRLYQLQDQIIADDEWHALSCILENDFASVFQHFGISDHCIPMTLLDILFAKTVGLSELGMRALPLASGLAALVVLPALLWNRFGPATTLSFTALLAISPLHTYYSRYARPYAVVFLLCLVGMLTFEQYLTTGRRRWAWIYVCCAILAPWFLPVMLPLALAPLLFPFLRVLRDRRAFLARFRELLPFALVIAAGQLVLLGPPVFMDFETIRARSHLGHLDRSTFIIGYGLMSGTERPATEWLFGVALLAGLFGWLHHRRELLAYFAFVFACGAAAILYSMPEGVEGPIVAVRYMIPALGIFLLLAADGLTEIGALIRKWLRWFPAQLPAVALCGALVLFSPVLSPLSPQNRVYIKPNAWTNHGMYQYQYPEAQRRRWMWSAGLPVRVSKFYTSLGKGSPEQIPGVQHIVEAPWQHRWTFTPYAYYQRVHHRRMSVGFLQRPGLPTPSSELPWPDDRFRFRNFVSLFDLKGMRERGVTHVVFHKNLAGEVKEGTDKIGLSIWYLVLRYIDAFGQPCFEDEDLIVFDVRTMKK